MRHCIETILILTSLLSFCSSQKQLTCINGGVNIMVRTKQEPYSIFYQCLCPFTYYGETCGFFRDINCLFTNQKVSNYQPTQNPTAKFQFQMECFLKKVINQTQPIKLVNNYLKLPLSDFQIQQQLKKENYYIDENYDIVWANTTSIFDEQGNLIKSDNRTDAEILDSYPHYQFNYSQYFYGIPLLNSKIMYSLNAVRFVQKDILLATSENITFSQTTSQIPENKTKIIGNFEKAINESWGQYGVVRLELIGKLYYGDGFKIYQRLGMDSARWRVYNPNFVHGEIIQINNNKLPGSFWILFVFILSFGLITGSRMAIKYYKNWKSKKRVNEMLDESQNENGKE